MAAHTVVPAVVAEVAARRRAWILILDARLKTDSQ
jgi:hypothetical protein